MLSSYPQAGALRRQRWLLFGLLVFFVGIHLQYLGKLTHSENETRSAFLRWRTQLQDLDEGSNVWARYAYPNPPIMAMILKPFMQLPPLLGASLWFAAKALLTLAAVAMVLSLLDAPEQPFPLWGKILAVGMSLRPLEGDLVHGNVNLFILFLVMTSIYAFCHHREYSAGLLLSLSIACKVTPALFIAYFLWKRAWKTLLAVTFGLVLFVLVLPGLWFGWSDNLDYLQSWHEQMVAPYAAGVVTSEHKNQSLPGLLHRMLSDEPSFSDYVGDQKIVLDTHHVANLSPNTVQAIVVGCMIAFALLGMWVCRPSTANLSNLQLLAECSIVLLGMLLFCERTWKHHCVTLLLPFSVAAYGVSGPLFGRGVRCGLFSMLVAVAALMLATSGGHVDASIEASSRWGKLAQVYGAYVWGFLLLTGGMAVMLCRLTASPRP